LLRLYCGVFHHGVETDTAGFTLADELAVLASTPASEAALPVPVELADVPEPSLLASPLPSANELESAAPVVASVDASELASICASADAAPSPTEVAPTSTLAEDDAEAVPSVLEIEAAAVADPVPLIEPPPVVESSISASAADDEVAELTSAEASEVPDAK